MYTSLLNRIEFFTLTSALFEILKGRPNGISLIDIGAELRMTPFPGKVHRRITDSDILFALANLTAEGCARSFLGGGSGNVYYSAVEGRLFPFDAELQ